MDILKAIRVLAARAVTKKDGDYVFRFLCRWYSRSFNTDIEKAEEKPIEDLLMHYFEVQYEGMEEEELEEEIQRLCETDAERADREAKEAQAEADDLAFLELMREEAKVEEAKRKLEEAKLAKEDALMWAKPPDKRLADSPQDKKLRELPPDIKITFVPESELDDLDAQSLLGPPKRSGG